MPNSAAVGWATETPRVNTRMIQVIDYERAFVQALPETHRLLTLGRLVVHPVVSRITVHGSRGLAGGHRPDSDIDLALHVPNIDLPGRSEQANFLRHVLQTTLESWNGPAELDLAVVFDKSGCGLRCFDRQAWDGNACERDGVSCLGLYKIQKGFDGFVEGPAVQVKLMYPMLTVWCSR